jgi:hypothetical protein
LAEGAVEISARLCQCARCRVQFLVCRQCDRGRIYCGEECSHAARAASLTAAGRRYQLGLQGRLHHAERQRRYRARKQKVTHQGSPVLGADVVLAAGPVVSLVEPPASNETVEMPESAATEVVVQIQPQSLRCRFCHCRCSSFLRIDYLRTGRTSRVFPNRHRGGSFGHSP